MENPTDGSKIEGPLIIGTALLHTPHMGEAAALFEAVPSFNKGERHMSDEMVNVPKSWFDKMLEFFTPKAPAEPTPELAPVEPPAGDPVQMTAVVHERDEYKAKFEALEAAQAKADQLSAIRAEFATEEFGAAYIELGKAPEAAEMMARMDEDMRQWCMQTFRALSKQINESGLTADIGATGEGDAASDPSHALNQMVLKVASEKKVDYNTAFAAVRLEHPKIVEAYEASRS